MRFTVHWEPSAEGQLAAIWLDADDRAAVRRAADDIDGRLAENAHLHGDSREARTRIDFCEPLGVEFEVYKED